MIYVLRLTEQVGWAGRVGVLCTYWVGRFGREAERRSWAVSWAVGGNVRSYVYVDRCVIRIRWMCDKRRWPLS